ncbi:hypothetical protein AK812_SmicGene28528 [Symbiodinium microadriaticum]|uniref:Uncharacterized protein n=1 Tax=Symbiodinium microadriaticum TaxID=2951 RepID=A0A1Q9D487_SYMMI|nr:hypothetical protein AK812_SmicGene28528 [Symbiodinium microadriaticum]
MAEVPPRRAQRKACNLARGDVPQTFGARGDCLCGVHPMHEEMEEQTSAQLDQEESTTGGQTDAASSQRAAQLATALIKRLRSQAEGEKLLDRYQVEGS